MRIKTILTLVVLFLAGNAAVRAADAYWTFVSFREAVQTIVIQDRDRRPAELHQRIMTLAGDRRVAIDPANVDIVDDREQITVHLTYHHEMIWVPRFYKQWWTFQDSVGARRTTQPK